MEEIVLESNLKVGKEPDYLDKKFGKLQISSLQLAEHVGKVVRVKVIVQIWE